MPNYIDSIIPSWRRKMKDAVDENPHDSSYELARSFVEDYNIDLSQIKLKTIANRIAEVRSGRYDAELAHESRTHTIDGKIFGLIKNGNTSVAELSDVLDVPPSTVKASLGRLSKSGVDINADGDSISNNINKIPGEYSIDLPNPKTKRLKFGVISDTHYGSKQCREDFARYAYKQFEKEKVDFVVHAGNWIDGLKRGINEMEVEDWARGGYWAQIQGFVQRYPRAKGIKTYFIDANEHEGWWRKSIGANPGRTCEALAQFSGRDDLVYVGLQEVDLNVNGTIIKLIHPGGGSPKAFSHPAQKFVDSLFYSIQGNTDVDFLIVGHHHKTLFMEDRGVHVLMAGSTKEQDPFMRGNSNLSSVSAAIVDAGVDGNGRVHDVVYKVYHGRERGYYKENDMVKQVKIKPHPVDVQEFLGEFEVTL